jgi:hypothetical protein
MSNLNKINNKKIIFSQLLVLSALFTCSLIQFNNLDISPSLPSFKQLSSLSLQIAINLCKQ